jgi:hypothetical protein
MRDALRRLSVLGAGGKRERCRGRGILQKITAYRSARPGKAGFGADVDYAQLIKLYVWRQWALKFARRRTLAMAGLSSRRYASGRTGLAMQRRCR